MYVYLISLWVWGCDEVLSFCEFYWYALKFSIKLIDKVLVSSSKAIYMQKKKIYTFLLLKKLQK